MGISDMEMMEMKQVSSVNYKSYLGNVWNFVQ